MGICTFSVLRPPGGATWRTVHSHGYFDRERALCRSSLVRMELGSSGHRLVVCFSMTADIVAGTVLVPVAAVSLGHVRHAREIPLAALPAVFAVHQFIESLVWAHDDGYVSAGVAHAAALAYVAIALPLLPILFPSAVLLAEPSGRRGRAVVFLLIGLVVSAWFVYAMSAHPLRVTVHPHAIGYDIGLQDGVWWAVLYVVAVVGSALLSGYRTIIAFGIANLVGLIVVGVAYTQAFASLWCVYAAVTSVLVATHMVRRRHVERSVDERRARVAAGG